MRFDHGPEFIAYLISDWCGFNGTDTVFIDPGSPWQNGWIESFNGSLRDEWFKNGQRFDSLLEAQVLLEDWRIDYNMNRPHRPRTAGSPQSEFVETWLHQQRLRTSHSGSINYWDPLGGFPPAIHRTEGTYMSPFADSADRIFEALLGRPCPPNPGRSPALKVWFWRLRITPPHILF